MNNSKRINHELLILEELKNELFRNWSTLIKTQLKYVHTRICV